MEGRGILNQKIVNTNSVICNNAAKCAPNVAASVKCQRSEKSHKASGGRRATGSFMYIKQVPEVPLSTPCHIIIQRRQGNSYHIL